MINDLYNETGLKKLCISGGVGLNSLANGKIYDETPFKNIHIFGPAGDGGASLGAALYSYHTKRKTSKKQGIYSLKLGTSYSDEEIKKALSKRNLNYKELNEDELIEKVVSLLIQGKIVGWFQGKMEFGPRALGSRSILAKPSPVRMKDEVNKIKNREDFRPFAASVLQEKVHEFFEVPEKKLSSPHMNFVFKARENKKDKIAAVVHKDGTTRIQTVNSKDGIYYKLIKEFYKKTSVPLVLNTSFNVAGEPIVELPGQAIDDLATTHIDYLAIGNYLVKKP
jgi:carbamoyltransferase